MWSNDPKKTGLLLAHLANLIDNINKLNQLRLLQSASQHAKIVKRHLGLPKK